MGGWVKITLQPLQIGLNLIAHKIAFFKVLEMERKQESHTVTWCDFR